MLSSCEGSETPDGSLWPRETAGPEAGGPDGCPGHECTLKIYPDAGWICFLKRCASPPRQDNLPQKWHFPEHNSEND